MKQTQRGNILFLILLAVVLFAALAYAVTSSMRGGGKDAGNENAELGAAQILQWFASVDAAVMRMNMNGVKYEDISFTYDTKYYNGNPLNNYMNNVRCTSDMCRVFKPEGGSALPPSFTKYATPDRTGVTGSSLDAGAMTLYLFQWPGAGTDLNDVVMILTSMKPSVCEAIRKKIGQSTYFSASGSEVNGNIVANWDSPAYVYTGNYNFLMGTDTYVSATAGSGNGQYCLIYHVVIKR